ncbi:MAG TPA: site-specific DNA-methyltransferase [Anaerolineales bacterium]|nr:site-specific DNA-methyltransferase [Anaerolineales bacterium]
MSESLPLNSILHGDCIEILKSLPQSSVDLVFADPPYNLQLRNELYRPNMTKVKAVNDGWDQFKGFADYDAFTKQWLSACRGVLKETGTIWVIGSYHNIFRVGSIMQDLGFWILNDIVWIKGNPMPNFRGVRFTNAHETLIWAQKKQGTQYTFNYKSMKALNDDLQMRSDWHLNLATGKQRIRANGIKAHSTQKPEALLYRVLMASSNPGDVVLDPFFGTGTTGAVAKKLGRNWIGIERDGKYIQIAQERIDAVEQTDEVALVLEKRKQIRVPFGALLENGFLQPGQVLYFAKNGKKAKILSNGHLRCGKITGSIHGVAKSLMKDAPANGWDLWCYEDENGNKVSIDALREKIRTSNSINDFSRSRNKSTEETHV